MLDWNKKEAPVLGLQGSGGGLGYLAGGASGSIGPLLFPMSRKSNGDKFFHAVKTDGTIVGTFQAAAEASSTTYGDFRIGNYYYWYSNGSGVIQKTNLEDFTITALPSDTWPVFGWAPIAENKFISIRYNQYKILDIDAETVTTTNYAASSYSSRAGTLTTLSHTTSGENVFSTGSYVFSTGGQGGSPYPLHVARHSRSGTVLSNAQAWFNTGANYSRTFGIHDSHGNTNLIIRDDGGFHYVRQTAAAGTLTPSTLSGWSHVYNNGQNNFSNHCIANGRWYHYKERSISTYVYEFALVYQNLDPSASQTVVDTGIRVPGNNNSNGGSYNRPSSGTYLTTINTDGYVAIAYWDKYDQSDYLTDRLRIKVIDRNNNVVSNNYVDVGTSYTNGNNAATWGMIGSGFVTDTLYSGSAYS